MGGSSKTPKLDLVPTEENTGIIFDFKTAYNGFLQWLIADSKIVSEPYGSRSVLMTSSTRRPVGSKVTIHNGPYSTIPSNTTPGLQFLKYFMPALDSLDAVRNPISPFLTPDSSIIVGSQPATPGNRFIPLLEVRNKHLAQFRHDLEVAWDIEHPSVAGDVEADTRRTVMFEATSVTVFKNDPDQFGVKVKEFNILELIPASPHSSSAEQQERGLLAREVRTYMDARPVQDRAARLQSQSTFAQSRSHY